MKLLYWLISSSFLAGYLCSDSNYSKSNKGNKRKSESISSIYSNLYYKNDVTVDKNSISEKRQLSYDLRLIADLESMIENGLSLSFINVLKREGCQLMNPINSSLLELVIKKGNTDIIDKLFKSVCKGNIGIYMHAVELTVSLNYSLLYDVLKSAFDSDYFSPAVLVNYFLNSKNFEAIKMMLSIGYRMDKISNFTHHLALNSQYKIINEYGKNLHFDTRDDIGKFALFYANDKKTIKAIRRVSRNGRDQKNFQGLTIWQEVLLDKNFERLKSLISLNRRIKKMRKFYLNYFKIRWVLSATILRINRDSLLKSSFKSVQNIRPLWYKPKHKFFIKFIGEIGMDNGGLKIDWITNLVQKFFTQNPTGTTRNFTAPLFSRIDEESGLYAPNTNYSIEIFRFAGSIVGISLGLGVPLKVKFIPSIYKRIFREEIDLEEDLLIQNPSIHRNLNLLLDPEFNLNEASLTFPSNPSSFVNKRNVKSYINEVSYEILYKKYKKEISAFVCGFESVLPMKICNFISRKELIKILMGKANDYTADEFIKAVSFNCKKVKQDFHKLISEFDSNQKKLLLKFITGSDCLPIEGFVGLEVQINILIFDFLKGQLPESSTCSNTLKLPPYSNYEEMKQGVIMAIEMTFTFDQEHGVIAGDGIVLGIDDDTDGNDIVAHEVESESDVSDDEAE